MSNEDFLRAVPLFSGLSDVYLGSIAKLARERTFAPGETIVAEGEEGVGMYTILSGQVEVLQRGNRRDILLGRLGPGEVFGELALLTHRRRLATVRATEETRCLILLSITFDKILEHSPDVGRTLCRTLARWLEEADDRARFADRDGTPSSTRL
jgi:CRP-like cAMP-binding protein